MRLAVLSDVHGNLAALEAVLADIREAAPDLILHGGDLADNGAHPVEVLETIRGLGIAGVAGNTDEMLFAPESLQQFPALPPQIAEMAEATRAQLGAERIAWLRQLPREYRVEGVRLVHATPASLWRAPAAQALDEELSAAFGPAGPLTVYGHIHVPFVRESSGLRIANSGSAGMPYDGDSRAAYLLIDDGAPAIRRVEYDAGRECAALKSSFLPHAEWIACILRAGRPMPPPS